MASLPALGPYAGRWRPSSAELRVDLGPEHGEPGPLAITLFYPCALRSEEHVCPERAPWLPHWGHAAGWGDVFSRGGGAVPRALSGVVASALFGRARLQGCRWCPPAAAAASMRVVVFSHGLATWASHYSVICSTLASQGYLVLAVDHRDGSGIGHGKTAFRHPAERTLAAEKELRREQVRLRLAECEAALDVAERLHRGELRVPGAPEADALSFEGLLQLAAPAIVGHSFGGGTAVLAAQRAPGLFACAVALDPWTLPVGSELAATPPPIDLLVVYADSGPMSGTPLWRRNIRPLDKAAEASGRVTVVRLRGAAHTDWSDTALMLPALHYLTSPASALGPYRVMGASLRAMLEFLGEHAPSASATATPPVLAAGAQRPRYVDITSRL